MSKFVMGLIIGEISALLFAAIVTVHFSAIGDRELLGRYQQCVAAKADAEALMKMALTMGALAEAAVLKNDGRL